MSNNSYSQILKSTGITGIAQFLQIIFKIVGNKFIAVLIGPAGLGYAGILQSTAELIGTATGAGLGQSAVRDIAVAVKSNDSDRIALTLTVFRRLVWITGCIGMLLTILFSAQFSRWAFGDVSHAGDLRMISVIVLFGQIASGQQAVLQGYRQLKWLAVSSVTGTLVGLCISIPLYRIYHIEAVVPAIIITSCIYLICTIVYSGKIKISKSKISISEFLQHGKYMITFGISLMLSGFFLLFSMYQIRILISNRLGVYYVGIFQAGWGITMIYLQMIFQAMSRDYYPRLSAVSSSDVETSKLVNEQLHIAILIAAPVIGIMLFISPWLISIMYSAEFSQAVPMFQWLLIGTLFKVFVWPVAFILPARRTLVIYMLTEAVASLGIWLITYLFIDRIGVEAVGVAYFINYILYSLLIFFVIRLIMNLTLYKLTIKIIAISTVLIATIFCLQYMYSGNKLILYINSILLILLFGWSYLNLDKLIGIRNIGKMFFFRTKHKPS